MPPPARHAATTPELTAITTENTSVIAVSDTVAGSRCPISVITGTSEKIEMPRLPCSSRHAQCTNCTVSGSLSPSRSRIAAMFAGVALSPAMIAAGSPGARCSSRNTNRPTSAITTRVARMRRAM